MSFRRLLLALAVMLLLPLTACGGNYSDEPEYVASRTLRVLSIGNSFSGDALFYTPFIIGAVAPQVEVKMGILYRAGCSLEQHVAEGISGRERYGFYTCGTRSDRWSCRTATLADALASDEWDIVIVQQASPLSRNYGTYQPYLDELTAWVDAHLQHPHRFAWLVIQAYDDGYERLYGDRSDAMAGDIAACTLRVMGETAVNIVIPCGTAVQCARHSALNGIGDFGGMTHDGFHLQDGIPRLVANYTAAATILQQLHLSPSLIMDDATAYSDQWIRQHGIDQIHGLVAGMSDENVALAKQCALDAVATPIVEWNKQ